MVHILDIFVSIAMSTILFLAGCSDKAVKDNEGNGGSDNEGDEPVETEYLQLYPAPGNLAQNVIGMDHSVWVNDQSCFVYRTEATGGGDYGSVYPEYAYFDFKGSVAIKVKPNYSVSSVEILPSRAQIVPKVNGSEISFVIREPGQYFVKINGDSENGSSATKNLYIFANPPEIDAPSKDDPNVVYFAPGVYEHKFYKLESNKIYYIAGGAFVYGRFYGVELQNVTIRGRGVICGEHLTSLGDEGRIVCINKKSNNIKIEGINVMHPKVWTIAMYQSNNIHIDNVHTISHGMSSDGCDITGCHDVLVENSFFRGHDDILAVKARDFINEMPVPQTCENVTFRNCVVWCDSSNPMTIGYETNQDIRNIRYERIDVLNISRPNVWQLEAVMAIEPHNEGVVDGVVYKDIRVDVKVPQNSLFRFVVDEGTGTIRNVRIEDVYINYGGTLGGIIYGTTQAEVSGVDFINVRNSEGLSLAEDKVTTNVYTSNINVSPNLKNGTWVGEVWDFSTEFSGFSSEQGRFDWYYKYLDGSEMKELLWNSSRNFWDVDTYCYIGWQRTDTNPVRNFPQMAAAMHPDVNKQPILIWKAPASGKILVRGKVRRPGTCGDGVDVSVRKNYQIPFWSMTIESSNQNFVDMGTNTVSVNKGDEVQFMVSMRGDNGCDNIEWLPVIEYLSLE